MKYHKRLNKIIEFLKIFLFYREFYSDVKYKNKNREFYSLKKNYCVYLITLNETPNIITFT